MTERGESIGLLELYLEDEPTPETVAEIGQVAHLLAFVVIANQRHTDLFEWGQRSRSFSLSAEIQQRLLPGPRTCEAAAFTLSGWLEPAASIGGDTFDYSLDRDLLHLSLTDAMGHGVGAALTRVVVPGQPARLPAQRIHSAEQATETNKALADHATTRGLDDFVTGLLARVDLRTGTCEIVNAGHVAPYLARGTDVTALVLPADLPFGLFADTDYRSTRVTLRDGDRLVLVTDGMLEHSVGSRRPAREHRQHPGASSARARPGVGRQRPGGHRPAAQLRRHHPVPGLARDPRPGTFRRLGGRPRSRQQPARLTTTSPGLTPARCVPTGTSGKRSFSRRAAQWAEPSTCVMLSGDNTGTLR